MATSSTLHPLYEKLKEVWISYRDEDRSAGVFGSKEHASLANTVAKRVLDSTNDLELMADGQEADSIVKLVKGAVLEAMLLLLVDFRTSGVELLAPRRWVSLYCINAVPLLVVVPQPSLHSDVTQCIAMVSASYNSISRRDICDGNVSDGRAGGSGQ